MYAFIIVCIAFVSFASAETVSAFSGNRTETQNGLPQSATACIRFQENRGQVVDASGRVRTDIAFVADAPGARLYLRNDGISYVFSPGRLPEETQMEAAGFPAAPCAPLRAGDLHRLDMIFAGMQPSARLRAEGQLPGIVNYYLPHRPGGVTGVREYGRIVYENVYDNVDMELFSVNGRMKYNFIVRPGGKVPDIRMQYVGFDDLDVTITGALAVATPLGRLQEAAPYSWAGAEENTVASRFVREGNTISFNVADYDRNSVLVIDPWATYFGGSGTDVVNSVVVDGNGNMIVSGYTTSVNFPVSPGAAQSALAGGEDAYCAKFSPTGARLWATYFGGSGLDESNGAAVDANGDVGMCGYTQSVNLPVTAGAFQTSLAGGGDAFALKLDANGLLLWATYYGGRGEENSGGMGMDGNGCVLFGGSTSGAKSFPISPGAFQTTGSGFIVKLNSNGTRAWATFFGNAHIWGVTADANRNVYVTGMGSVIPTGSGAFQPVCAGGVDAVLAKFNENGGWLWSTFIGGTVNDWGRSVAACGSDNVVVSGYTSSTNFPVSTGAFQTSYAGGTFDIFVAHFTSTGVRNWSTYYGSPGSDVSRGVSMDAGANTVFTGYTSSSLLPVSTGALQGASMGGYDGCIVKFNATGTRLWGTYYGGSGSTDQGHGVTIESGGDVLVCGATNSTDLPVLAAYQSANAGGVDGFIVRLNADGQLPGYNIPPVAAASASPAQGSAPLAVVFSSSASHDQDGSIVSFAWDFGDGGSSAEANPTHTYLSAGTFHAILSVTDDGNKTDTDTVTITVNAAGSSMHVDAQTVTRVQAGTNKWKGSDLVLVHNDLGQPVSGATVFVSYSGPTSGTANGMTGVNGSVTLLTGTKTNPVGLWCFTVTNVQKTGYVFDPNSGILSACETMPKATAHSPESPALTISPNPFSTGTTARIELPEPAHARLRIVDLAGRTVATVLDTELEPGSHQVHMSAEQLPSGIYFATLEAGAVIRSCALVVTR